MTPRQKKLYDFIKSYAEKNGHSPSYEEMMIAMNLKSKSGIHRLTHSLRTLGKVQFADNRARSIEIVPDDYVEPRRSDLRAEVFWRFLQARGLERDFVAYEGRFYK